MTLLQMAEMSTSQTLEMYQSELNKIVKLSSLLSGKVSF